jgi:hypothetical protein
MVANVGGANCRACATRTPSSSSKRSSRMSQGSLTIVRVTRPACAGEIAPCAWAAATCANSAGIGSPVSDARGPIRVAASTRADASYGLIRSSPVSMTAVDRQPRSAARPRRSASPTSR